MEHSAKPNWRMSLVMARRKTYMRLLAPIIILNFCLLAGWCWKPASRNVTSAELPSSIEIAGYTLLDGLTRAIDSFRRVVPFFVKAKYSDQTYEYYKMCIGSKAIIPSMGKSVWSQQTPIISSVLKSMLLWFKTQQFSGSATKLPSRETDTLSLYRISPILTPFGFSLTLTSQ